MFSMREKKQQAVKSFIRRKIQQAPAKTRMTKLSRKIPIRLFSFLTWLLILVLILILLYHFLTHRERHREAQIGNKYDLSIEIPDAFDSTQKIGLVAFSTYENVQIIWRRDVTKYARLKWYSPGIARVIPFDRYELRLGQRISSPSLGVSSNYYLLYDGIPSMDFCFRICQKSAECSSAMYSKGSNSTCYLYEPVRLVDGKPHLKRELIVDLNYSSFLKEKSALLADGSISNGFAIQIELVSNDHRRMFIEAVRRKYNLDKGSMLNSSQIFNFNPFNLKCNSSFEYKDQELSLIGHNEQPFSTDSSNTILVRFTSTISPEQQTNLELLEEKISSDNDLDELEIHCQVHFPDELVVSSKEVAYKHKLMIESTTFEFYLPLKDWLGLSSTNQLYKDEASTYPSQELEKMFESVKESNRIQFKSARFNSNSMVNIQHLILTQDERSFITYSSNRDIKQWNTENGDYLNTLHQSGTSRASEEPGFLARKLESFILKKNNQLVSVWNDGTIQIWNLNTGLQVKSFNVYMNITASVLDSQVGHITVGSDTGEIQVWSLESQQKLHVFVDYNNLTNVMVTSLYYSPKGQYLVSAVQSRITADQKINVWNLKKGFLEKELLGSFAYLTFSVTSNELVIGSRHDGVQTWNIETGRWVKFFSIDLGDLDRYDQDPSSLLVGRDFKSSELMLNNKGDVLVTKSWNGIVKAYNMSNGDLIRQLSYKPAVEVIRFNRNDELITVSTSERSIRWWNLEKGLCTRVLSNSRDETAGRVYSLASSHRRDSKQKDWLLAAGFDSGVIKIWNLKTAECVRTILAHSDDVIELVVSHDNEYLISGSRDGWIKWWSMLTGECVRSVALHDSSALSKLYQLTSLLIDSDKLIVSSSSGLIKVLDVESGSSLIVIHADMSLNSLTLHNNTLIGESIDDQVIRLWSMETGELVRSLYPTNTSKALLKLNANNNTLFYNQFAQSMRRKSRVNTRSVIGVGAKSGWLVSGGWSEHRKPPILMVWDAEFNYLFNLTGHRSDIKSISFFYDQNDNEYLISASSEDIRFWNVTSGGQLVKVVYCRSLNYFIFVESTRQLISGHLDKSIQIWSADFNSKKYV